MRKLTLVVSDETSNALLPLLMGILKATELENMHLERLPDAETHAPGPRRASRTRRLDVPGHPPVHRGRGLWFKLAANFKIGEAFTVKQAQDYAVAIDYNVNSASGVLSDLVGEGFASRMSEGVYMMLKPVPPDHQFAHGRPRPANAGTSH